MGLFVSGEMAQVGSGSKYVRLDDKITNIMYVLHPDLDTVLSAAKQGVYVKSKAPFNASWVFIGPEDVGNELGLRPTPKAFLWVLQAKNPKDLSEGFETKLWECSKPHYEAISSQVNEYGIPLQGMMLGVTKTNGRWNIVANTPKKGKEVPAAVLEAAWAEVEAKGLGGSKSPAFDEKAFGDVVGVVPSKALQRKMLIEKAKAQGKPVETWNGVLKLFGLPPVADGGPASEENDVVGYDE